MEIQQGMLGSLGSELIERGEDCVCYVVRVCISIGVIIEVVLFMGVVIIFARI
jgi:hypothetical protein